MRFRFALLTLLLLATQPAVSQSILFSESFDSVTAPDLPTGWQTDGTGFSTSTSSAGPASGLNNLLHKGTATGSLISPPIPTNGHPGIRIHYNARRSGTYGPEQLHILVRVNGTDHTIAQSGEALPFEASKYESISIRIPDEFVGSEVQIVFHALGGSGSSSSLRIDDLEVHAMDDVSPSSFGFTSGVYELPELAESAQVPLALELTEHEGSLQALQFDLDVISEGVLLAGVRRGPAIQDFADWTLKSNGQGSRMSVVLIGTGQTSLDPGHYDDLIILELATGDARLFDVPRIGMSGLVGATSSRTGQEASLQMWHPAADVILTTAPPVFEVSASEIDFGVVQTNGERTVREITISNPGGEADLEISQVASTNHAFSASPESAIVKPNEEVAIQVAFDPAGVVEGSFHAELTIDHNAGPTAVVALSITVGGIFGDATDDGIVDVLDLVEGIDQVIGISVPTAASPVDVYPFPGGDEDVDVRDLTVLSHAIALDVWPDGTPVMSDQRMAAKAPMSKGTISYGIDESGIDVTLQASEPVRAVHLALGLQLDHSRFSFTDPLSDGLQRLATIRPKDGALSMVFYRVDGGFLPAGEFYLGRLRIAGVDVADVRPLSGVAGSMVGEALHLDASVVAGSTYPKLESGAMLAVYPRPFMPTTHGSARIDLAEPGLAEIFDARGRLMRQWTVESAQTIKWDGTMENGAPVPSGLYLVRSGGVSQTMMLIR